jgi:hypothetical protein
MKNKKTTPKCCGYNVKNISIKEINLDNIYYIELWNQTINSNSLLKGHYYLVFNIQTKKYALQRFFTNSDEPITTNENNDLFIDKYIKNIINEAINTITYYPEFIRELKLFYFNIGKELEKYERQILSLINLVNKK